MKLGISSNSLCEVKDKFKQFAVCKVWDKFKQFMRSLG